MQKQGIDLSRHSFISVCLSFVLLAIIVISFFWYAFKDYINSEVYVAVVRIGNIIFPYFSAEIRNTMIVTFFSIYFHKSHFIINYSSYLNIEAFVVAVEILNEIITL